MSEIDWPEDAGGMNVGRVLEKLLNNPIHKIDYPKVMDQLRAIGFPVDDDWRATVWREKTMGALRTFYSIYGHTNVRIDFVVPRSDPWPVCTWGYTLGKLVDSLRRVYDTKLNDDELRDLQSVKFHSVAMEGEWVDVILPSLEIFAQHYGHCHVGLQFVVPSTPPWPQRAWGYRLGSTVTMMRTVGTRAKQAARDADRLNAIGFIWGSMAEHRWREYVMPSFEAFATIHGSCERIPIDFVVPSEVPWPEKTWGVRLRKLLNNIRFKGYFPNQIERDQQRLEELGVKWK